MTAAQELFALLKDAKPKQAHHSKAPAKAQPPALKAIRFSVELPELGGGLALSPWVGFEPVFCKTCGAHRENQRESMRDEKTNKVVHWCRPTPCGVCR